LLGLETNFNNWKIYWILTTVYGHSCEWHIGYCPSSQAKIPRCSGHCICPLLHLEREWAR
jgi:hypothetical protein